MNSFPQKYPICPVISVGMVAAGSDRLTPCLEGKCAWWDAENQKCFVAIIGLALVERSDTE